jgi:hypothetical protein
MKNYTINVTVNLKVVADNEDAMRHLLQEMDYKFTHVDRESEIVDSQILDFDVVAEY